MSLPVPPLMPVNYTSWAIKVEAIHDAQGLWGVVVPEDGAAIDAKKSKTARALLLGALPEDVLMQVRRSRRQRMCGTVSMSASGGRRRGQGGLWRVFGGRRGV